MNKLIASFPYPALGISKEVLIGECGVYGQERIWSTADWSGCWFFESQSEAIAWAKEGK